MASFVDPRIVWFDLPKAPLSGYANRNIALRRARGRYVAYAQHDDLWFPDHLALLLDAIGDADWAYSRPLWVGRDGAIVPCPVNLRLADELEHFMTVENSVPSTCVLHTRSAVERVGYWPENIALLADWIYWQSIIASATRGLGHCRSVTCLHFPTILHDRVSAPERAWRESAKADWWPAILRCPKTDSIEQEALWRALQEGGNAWLAAMRDATDTVLDRVALTSMRGWAALASQLEAAQMEAALCRFEAERARADAALQRETLGVVYRSRSWRWMAPMRAVATALGR